MTTYISVLCDVTFNYVKNCIPRVSGDCLGRDHMVAGFTTIYAISAYHNWCWEFVSNLRQVDGFLRFPTLIKLTATTQLKYCWKRH